jgi:hypothetical protein
MNITHQPHLTASEISNLWISFMTDSMAVCGLKHFLIHIKDENIRSVVKYGLHLASAHVDRVTAIMKEENYPLPQGFTEHDIYLQAPPLFTDVLVLMYMSNMAKFGLSSYSLALSMSSRRDVVQFYSECLASTTELNNRALEVSLEKGVYVRPPFIQIPEKIDFVHEKSYLGNLFGEKRSLLGSEISHIFYNMKRNALGKALMIGFGQVTKSDQIKDYFNKGKELSQKQIDVFSRLLTEDNLPAPMLWDGEVGASTTSPFSDKLMMFHVSALTASAIGQYGSAMSSSPRKDLAAAYARLSVEIALYAEEGTHIMIRNGWFENPPQAVDRKKLSAT